ncbi:MAG: hypothetical protein ACXWQ8_10185 [Ktedonobacterales bacterium]
MEGVKHHGNSPTSPEWYRPRKQRSALPPQRIELFAIPKQRQKRQYRKAAPLSPSPSGNDSGNGSGNKIGNIVHLLVPHPLPPPQLRRPIQIQNTGKNGKQEFGNDSGNISGLQLELTSPAPNPRRRISRRTAPIACRAPAAVSTAGPTRRQTLRQQFRQKNGNDSGNNMAVRREVCPPLTSPRRWTLWRIAHSGAVLTARSHTPPTSPAISPAISPATLRPSIRPAHHRPLCQSQKRENAACSPHADHV